MKTIRAKYCMKCGKELVPTTKSEYVYHFDAVLIGEEGVGKSTLLEKLATTNQAIKLPSTDGNFPISFPLQEIELVVTFTESSSNISMMGNEVASAAVLFDLTNRPTFIKSIRLMRMMDFSKTRPILYLVGNKLDLRRERKVSYEEALKTSSEFNSAYFEVSALTGEGVNRFQKRLIKDLLTRRLQEIRGLAHDE